MNKLRVIALVLLVVFFAVVFLVLFPSHAEETKMYVIASQLNGRAFPTKKAQVEARFDYGEIITATGNWSDDMKWVEIKAGENGTCWCKADYLTERLHTFTVENEHDSRIKIRKIPNGKVKAYLGAGKKTKITQVVLGWGKCSKGWVDLSYLIEIEEDVK